MDVRKIQLSPEDLRFVPPRFPEDAVAERVVEQYGLTGPMSPLEGERDQNYWLKPEDSGQKSHTEYVIKIASQHEDAEVIDFQLQALRHIEQQDPSLGVPRLLLTKDQELTTHIRDQNGQPHILRILEYLPGIPFGDSHPSSKGFEQIGRFQGRLSLALTDFKHPQSRHFMPWDISNGLVFNEPLLHQASPEARSMAQKFLPHLDSVTFPAMHSCRRQVIHNDCHAGNLLRANKETDEVTGVIDFGDIIGAPLVQDMAVSMAGFLVYESEPLPVLGSILKGYHQIYPLNKEEVALIGDLVIMRLVLTLLLFDFRLATHDNPPAFLAEEKPLVMNSLNQLGRLDRQEIINYLDTCCADT
ncbi:MAG: phosphotransferase [Gammaproteobacteria bacterium]|nr:phosphotransferase [Gammaproteobacteria bacterium]